MANDTLRHTDLVRAIPELLANLSDLIQKELRLARAEVSRGLKSGLQAGIWIGVAAFLGLIAVVLLAEGLVFLIASFGIALHWSCFLVAIFIGICAALSFYYGRQRVDTEDLTATRTVRQLNETMRTAKEQLT